MTGNKTSQVLQRSWCLHWVYLVEKRKEHYKHGEQQRGFEEQTFLGNGK